MSDQAPVVVGVDGTDSAISAARWAGAVAARVGAPLHIVHGRPTVGRNLTDTAAAIQAAIMTYQRDCSEIFLKAAADAVRADNPELAVTTSSSTIPADEALLDLSLRSRLIVLGANRISPGAALLLGSTTLAVATQAACPVVAWRGDRTAPDGQPIVVGVDDSPAAATALSAAFALADRLKVTLHAVHSWTARMPAADITVPLLIDWDALEAAQWTYLTNAVDQYRDRHPDVEVACYVEPTRPTQALMKHLGEAQLVVVGNRGRNALTSMLLGSTSSNLLHHSAVPVMVCHTGTGDQ